MLIGTPTTTAQRWLMGWFGIRGIGSLYYLTCSFSHGVSGESARKIAAAELAFDPCRRE
jgi:NhaP-type Na+/H+ or K+/H+ antiporter